MRTTITLDEDIAKAIEREMRRHPRMSFKDVVNSLLRAGLNFNKQSKASPRFVVRSRSMGIKRGLDYDNIGELLEQIEGTNHK
jgi:hypothetical protein